MARARQAEPEVQSITGAAASHTDDLDARVTRYLISMGIRTVCVVLTVVVPSPWRWFFAAGAVFLPYLAVVMANSSGGRRRGPGPERADRGAHTHHGGTYVTDSDRGGLAG